MNSNMYIYVYTCDVYTWAMMPMAALELARGVVLL